jgi:hypothetical protein
MVPETALVGEMLYPVPGVKFSDMVSSSSTVVSAVGLNSTVARSDPAAKVTLLLNAVLVTSV